MPNRSGFSKKPDNSIVSPSFPSRILICESTHLVRYQPALRPVRSPPAAQKTFKTFKSLTVSTRPHLSPKQIAQVLNTSESSVKRWCDQGRIPMVRTAGGHRRVPLAGLAEYLRDTGQNLPSEFSQDDPDTIGGPSLATPRVPFDEVADDASSNSNANVQPFSNQGVGSPSSPLGSPTADPTNPHRTTGGGSTKIPESVHLDFRKCLVRGDERGCRGIVRNILGTTTRYSIAEQLITDAMRDVGKAWQMDRLDVYQERLGVNICLSIIDELKRDIVVPADAAIAVGGTPPGDHYQLPSALVELALRENGWNAKNLGCNLPWNSLRRASIEHGATLLWLSVSEIEDVDSFIEEERQLHEAIRGGVALFVGGRALTDDIRPRLSFTSHCDRIENLLQISRLMRMAD